MQAYLGNVDLKAQLVAATCRHRDAGELAQGVYFKQTSDGHLRMGAIGCVLFTLAELEGTADPATFDVASADYEAKLGIPEVLAYLHDRIFDGLPVAEAPAWLEHFLRTIPVGADLALVWPRLAVWLLLDPHYGVTQYLGPERAVETVAALYRRRIAGEEPTFEEWRQASSDANTVDYAAFAATYAAAAAFTDGTLKTANAFAAAAATSAVSYYSDEAARVHFWRACRDELLRLLAASQR